MKNGSNFTPFYHRHKDRAPLISPARKPSDAEKIRDRKASFAALNDWVRARGGWVVSIPGELEITVECLTGSTLPDELRAIGHKLEPMGEGERILHTAIEERFARVNGELVPLTPGSTARADEVRHHAGLVRVLRFGFDFP